MANPAELLFDIFKSWNSNSAPVKARNDSDALPRHRLAVAHLNDIERLLDIMHSDGKRVFTYKKRFPQWVKIVFNYPRDWQHNYGTIEDGAMESLENLIDTMDSYVPKMDEARFDELKKYLDKVEKALHDDDSLSAAVTAGTMTLVQNLRTILDQYTVCGDLQLEQALERLLGNLAKVTLRSKHAARWRTLIDEFVFPYVVGQLPELPVGGLLSAVAELGS